MSTNVADILREHGFVPVVPEVSRPAGTAQTQARSRVPVVPAVPDEKHAPGLAAAKPAPDTRVMQEELLIVAGALGLPDALVYELPESELRACCEQSTWYADAEIAHRLLTFYLRSLAGVEPALPGTVAERHQAERQAHIRALRRRT